MSPADPRNVARRARRIVVKLGSGILAGRSGLDTRFIGTIARQVCALQDEGREVVVVSSGAVAMGSRELGWTRPGRSIPEKQAAAAIGQIQLVDAYRRRFARHQRKVAQVLLTRADLQQREQFLNARHTFQQLLELGVVPIVNENDTVATEEIRFGDNDNLSATVVNLVAADLLVILTDVEGLYREPPMAGRPLPALIPLVEAITPAIEAAASGSASAFGRGGMTTKLQAARSAAHCGAATILCRGRRRDALLAAARGETIGTLFLPGASLGSRKHWLAFTARTRGSLRVDDGAARALVERGRSLLAAGIVEVQGDFAVGDPVACIDARGRELARGLTAYGAAEVKRILGQSARQIERVLGYSNGDEVIHRDDLVLLQERGR